MSNPKAAGAGYAGMLVGVLVVSPVLAEISEITVTARRIEENLQKVPVSISAFSEETLQNAQISNVNDLINLVPNITYESGESGRRGAPTIRGIGLIDTRGFDNPVGVFIDGVYIGGRASQNVRLLDLQRVEVIRGPQSALYGRNTFSGAINYVTRRPSDVPEGVLEVTAGQSEKYDVFGYVSGPLFGDAWSGRLAAAWSDDGGMYDNRGPVYSSDGGIGGGDSTSFSAGLRFKPSDDLDVNFTAFYSEEDLDSRPLWTVPNNCGELDPALVFNSPANLPAYDQNVPASYCGEISATVPHTLSLSPDAYSMDDETTRLALDVEYDLGWATFNSITSWTQNDNKAKVDLDRSQIGEPNYGYTSLQAWIDLGSTVPLFSNVPPNFDITSFNTYIGSTGVKQDYFSQELRLSSRQDSRLRWTGGLYYFDQDSDDITDLALDATPAVNDLGLSPDEILFLLTAQVSEGIFLGIPNPVLPNVAFRQGSDMVTLVVANTTATQYSAFGSVEFDFTDRLIGSTELRYTYEERTLDNEFDIFFNTPVSSYKDDWSFWDPRFILRFQATDDLMVYGSAAHGSRSGGHNVAVSEAALVPYDEESNWTYELGLKSSWFDRRMQFNASVFYIDWQDAQFRQRVSAEGSASILTVTSNSTGITSRGIELELVAAPTERLTLGLTYGYSDPEFRSGTISTGESRLCDHILDPGNTEFPMVDVNCVPSGGNDFGNPLKPLSLAPDISGRPPARTAKTTASAFLEATTPVTGESDAFVRLDVAYRDEMPQNFTGTVWVPSRTLANLRLGIQNPRYDVMFWVENLMDEDAVDTSQVFSSNLNSFRDVITGVGIDPRRVGVTARYRFGGAVR